MFYKQTSLLDDSVDNWDSRALKREAYPLDPGQPATSCLSVLISSEGLSVSSPSKLSHVVFSTARLTAMCDWYIEVLGATVAFENPMLCFLAYDDEHHRIGLIAHDQPPEEVAEPEFAALPFGADVRAPRANGSLNN